MMQLEGLEIQHKMWELNSVLTTLNTKSVCWSQHTITNWKVIFSRKAFCDNFGKRRNVVQLGYSLPGTPFGSFYVRESPAEPNIWWTFALIFAPLIRLNPPHPTQAIPCRSTHEEFSFEYWFVFGECFFQAAAASVSVKHAYKRAAFFRSRPISTSP